MALFERGSMHLARTLSSLKHRNYRLLFFGTSLSHFAGCASIHPSISRPKHEHLDHGP
jgi:hypothetical protein